MLFTNSSTNHSETAQSDKLNLQFYKALLVTFLPFRAGTTARWEFNGSNRIFTAVKRHERKHKRLQSGASLWSQAISIYYICISSFQKKSSSTTNVKARGQCGNEVLGFKLRTFKLKIENSAFRRKASQLCIQIHRETHTGLRRRVGGQQSVKSPPPPPPWPFCLASCDLLLCVRVFY